ncbi:MAG: adenine deaminase, partial [Oscillospiraceae bacterium]|nr:adenine deaminase [Oscillospiraceae bacterium]
VLRLAVKAGFPFEQAVYCCTKVPAVRMRFFDRGEIRPGYYADFAVLKDEELFEPAEVYLKGKKTYTDGESRRPAKYPFPEKYYDSVHCAPITDDLFTLSSDKDKVTCRVICVHPDRTQTSEDRVTFEVRDGEVAFGDGKPNLCCVIERYGKTGGHAFGFMDGSCHNQGAVACTYCHDHHNLFVCGENKKDMAVAAERVRQMHGGFAVALDGRIIAEAALPVGGIMSDVSAKELGDQINEVTKAMVSLGYRHEDPIMSFCTVPLTVSPALKISDKGLIDVMESRLVDLFVD